MKAKPRLSYCFCKVKCAKSQHFSFAGGFAGTPSLAVGLFYTCILQGARQVQGPCCTNPNQKLHSFMVKNWNLWSFYLCKQGSPSGKIWNQGGSNYMNQEAVLANYLKLDISLCSGPNWYNISILLTVSSMHQQQNQFSAVRQEQKQSTQFSSSSMTSSQQQHQQSMTSSTTSSSNMMAQKMVADAWAAAGQKPGVTTA